MPPRIRALQGWKHKFALAARGIARAARGERSFRIHLTAVVVVIVAAAALRVTLVEWCVLILCMAVVLAAELFNTALERLARAITADENADIRDALDIAAGAVLVTAIGAAVVGVLVLVAAPLVR
jgi:diacylglycerol kinase